MKKYVEFSQFVARAINHTTWNIPKIRDGNLWRNIQNTHLVENTNYNNGHDRYENSIFSIMRVLENDGWKTEISEWQEKCHEHLAYHHFRLKCWK